MSLAEARAAQARGEGRSDLPRVQAGVPYVWDGRDEADRPLSREEMQAGLAAARRGRGRPAGSDKESTTIRLDRDILDSFRAQGPGPASTPRCASGSSGMPRTPGQPGTSQAGTSNRVEWDWLRDGAGIESSSSN
jgi:hypothetical protein